MIVAIPSEEEIWEIVMAQKWYVHENDYLDGWCITNSKKTMNMMSVAHGEFGIADFMNRDTAAHIVKLHNKSLKKVKT